MCARECWYRGRVAEAYVTSLQIVACVCAYVEAGEGAGSLYTSLEIVVCAGADGGGARSLYNNIKIVVSVHAY